VNSFKELRRRNRKRPGKLHQGVDPGNARTRLQQADLRSMQGCSKAELFLGQSGLATASSEVAPEPDGHLI
jgi:hypothetical protein